MYLKTVSRTPKASKMCRDSTNPLRLNHALLQASACLHCLGDLSCTLCNEYSSLCNPLIILLHGPLATVFNSHIFYNIFIAISIMNIFCPCKSREPMPLLFIDVRPEKDFFCHFISPLKTFQRIQNNSI